MIRYILFEILWLKIKESLLVVLGCNHFKMNILLPMYWVLLWQKLLIQRRGQPNPSNIIF